MEKQFTIQTPPEPAEIRERYAGFLSRLQCSLDHYRREFIDAMNERFELGESGKTRPDAN